GGAGRSIALLRRDPAALHEQDRTVFEAERRHDEVTRAPAPALDGVHEALAVVEELALRLDATELERASGLERARQFDGRSGDRGRALGDESFLPVQARNLPGAEPDQQKKRGGRRQGER